MKMSSAAFSPPSSHGNCDAQEVFFTKLGFKSKEFRFRHYDITQKLYFVFLFSEQIKLRQKQMLFK